MEQDENKAVQNTIQKLLGAVGEEFLLETEGPGVYYLAVREYGEMYIVGQASPIISDAAKSYGKTHPEYRGLLFYSLTDEGSGSKIIDYELEKHAIEKGLPNHDSTTLHAAAVYGAEDHPEYFGTYPAPIHTPRGYTTRYKCIENGIFWLETDQRQEVLTISYPLWSTILSEETIKFGVTLDWDRERGTHNSLACLFFRKLDACIPIFELMRIYPEWGQTGQITTPALMNAIWRNHPGYVLAHNAREQPGANDAFAWLMKQLGIEAVPNISVGNMIAVFPDIGLEYIHF